MKVPRAGGAIGALAAACAASGCFLITGPGVEYASQEKILAAAASAAGYSPDPGIYRLVGAGIAEDSITFQYLGVEHAGDSAWVIRFSQKSTEQKPESLIRLNDLLEAIADGKKGFEVVERGSRVEAGFPIQFARYRYRSIVRDDDGSPLLTAGVAGIARIDPSPAPIIYQFRVENFDAERADLGWNDLAPLVRAIPR